MIQEEAIYLGHLSGSAPHFVPRSVGMTFEMRTFGSKKHQRTRAAGRARIHFLKEAREQRNATGCHDRHLFSALRRKLCIWLFQHLAEGHEEV